MLKKRTEFLLKSWQRFIFDLSMKKVQKMVLFYPYFPKRTESRRSTKHMFHKIRVLKNFSKLIGKSLRSQEKEAPAQVFSSESFKNNFFTEHFQSTASARLESGNIRVVSHVFLSLVHRHKYMNQIKFHFHPISRCASVAYS